MDDTLMTPTELYNYMNDGQLSPYLFDPSYILMIDTRNAELYSENHIVTAYHISDLDIPGKISDMSEYTIILLYNTKTSSDSLQEGGVISKLMDDMLQKKLDPAVLTGGFETFLDKYPFLCTDTIISSGRERAQVLLQYPSEIVYQQLYLGRGDQATNEKIVSDLSITHIVNITTEHACPFQDKIKYLTIKLLDETSTNLFQHFRDIIKFVGDATVNGGRVLIHCNLGQSRSATVTIAYLMSTRGWDLKKSFLYVKERRPNIGPNRGFCQQLAEFEKDATGGNSIDPHELWMQ